MANASLSDAFNDCVDRLNAGESLDACLRDYPQHAERLRALLQTGDLVSRAIADGQDLSTAQAEGRARLTQNMQRRKAKPPQSRRWFMPLVAVLTTILVLGLGVIVLMSPGEFAPSAVELTGTTISQENVAVAMLSEATRTAAFALAETMTHQPSSTPFPEVIAAATLPFDPTLGAITLPTGDAISPSDIPLNTPAAVLMTPTSEPTLMFVESVDLSATPASITGDSGIVATSVLSMSPVPMTPAPRGTMTLHPTTTAMPSATTTVTATPPGTATALPTMTMASTQIAQDGTQVAALLTVTVSPMPSTPAPYPTLAPVQVIPLSAGEIDDNADWDTYLTYRRNYLANPPAPVLDIDVTGRQIIRVTDSEGLPVLGAQVLVYAGQTLVSETRTMADGQTLFFPNAIAAGQGFQSFRVVVQREQEQNAVEFTLEPSRGPLWDIALPDATMDYDPINLDVVFLLDATGSMADEIAQLQNNILVISSQIDALPGNIDARYGLVTYRDRGDAYVSQVYGLTSNLPDFQRILNGVQAGGGGDYPESLNQALDDTLGLMQWRGGDTIKLVFLVADAPPHLDYGDTPYTQSMVAAARLGIKIHPIASSGLDQQGEFILRQIAQYTLGHFIFLTYEQGGSGAPGEVRSDLSIGEPDDPADPQDEGDYSVEQLDELVLRLITDEINALGQRYPVGTPVPVSTRPAVNIGGSGFMPTPPPTQSLPFTPTPNPLSRGMNSTELSLRLNFGVIVLIVALLGLLAYALLYRWWYGRNFPPPPTYPKRKTIEKRKLGDMEFLIVDEE